MPIDYSKYPPDWKQTVKRIHARSGNRCEICGLENGSQVYGAFMMIREQGTGRYKRKAIWSTDEGTFKRLQHAGLIYQYSKKRVVLTIAHLDHDEMNWDVTDDRLQDMCQYCHLNYDSMEKWRRVTKDWSKRSLKEIERGFGNGK